MSDLAELVRSSPPDYRVKAQAVADHLRAQPDRGVAEATAFFREARDESEARYAADHVGVLPDLRDPKRALVALALDERPELLGAVTQPLRGAGPDLAERVVQAHLDVPTDESDSAAWEAARSYPAAVRKYSDRLDDEEMRLAVLPGAPDDVVARLEAVYREDPDPETLVRLSKIRTERALEALLAIAAEGVPDPERLDLYIESSGVFPDTRTASVWFDAFRGLIVRRGDSPHEADPGSKARIPRARSAAQRPRAW
jgi:hypothetical protein